MIGTIKEINADGTIQQGPIPGLGGPFTTAEDFFQAWCDNARFGLSTVQLLAACGVYAAEIVPSIESFPTDLAKMTSQLSKFNNGPFPLTHGDFGHNNIVVGHDWRILGVIDWEKAFAAPWEIAGDFPLTLSTVPPAMDAAWNYDDLGHPIDPDVARKFANQKKYIACIGAAENARGPPESPCLQNLLQDSDKQGLMTAMRLYGSGKVGYYRNMIPKIS